MTEYAITVPPEEGGRRLDVFLAGYFFKNKLGLSRAAIQKLIREGKVCIFSASVTQPCHKTKPLDEIKVFVVKKESPALQAEEIGLEVIYEDKDLAIINKPCGMVVHPAPGNYEHTLVNALMHRFKELSDINRERPGIVHRLDKDASGIMVIAKTNFAHLALSKQFASHSIKRKYAAVVEGRMEFKENVIELPIGRHPHKRKSMSAVIAKNPKYAKTYYRTIKRTQKASLLELEPFTGRTHQLRVHLAFIGHPILGDSKYGKHKGFMRLALHAKSLGFIHPRSAQYMEFSGEVPREFSEFFKGKT